MHRLGVHTAPTVDPLTLARGSEMPRGTYRFRAGVLMCGFPHAPMQSGLWSSERMKRMLGRGPLAPAPGAGAAHPSRSAPSSERESLVFRTPVGCSGSTEIGRAHV